MYNRRNVSTNDADCPVSYLHQVHCQCQWFQDWV